MSAKFMRSFAPKGDPEAALPLGRLLRSLLQDARIRVWRKPSDGRWRVSLFVPANVTSSRVGWEHVQPGDGWEDKEEAFAEAQRISGSMDLARELVARAVDEMEETMEDA